MQWHSMMVSLGLSGLGTRMRRQFTIGGVRHKLAVQIDIEDNGGGIAPTMLEPLLMPPISKSLSSLEVALLISLLGLALAVVG